MRSLRQVLAYATLAILPLGFIIAETTGTTTTTKKKTTAKRRTTTPKSGSSTATSSAANKRTTSTTRKRTTSTKGRTTASRPPARPRQLQPTPERYKEIQQALAGKGYLKSEPSGTWNQESMDALRRFQQDQNINASGKIDSLSLIALGLGPKRATSVTPPAPSTPSEPKPEPPPAANGSDPEDLN
jgi:hypothetical protein